MASSNTPAMLPTLRSRPQAGSPKASEMETDMTTTANQADQVLIDAGALSDWTTQIFVAHAVPEEQARTIADCLVRADLKGVSSHGVSRIPIYLKRLKLGLVRADMRPKIVRESSSTAVIDADNGFGHPAAMFGLRFAIDRAKKTGVAVAGVINSTHFGMAAHYGEVAAAEDCISLVTTNSSPRMAPWGAKDALFGTNPLAISATPRPLSADRPGYGDQRGCAGAHHHGRRGRQADSPRMGS